MNFTNFKLPVSKQSRTMQIAFRLGLFVVLAAVIVLMFPRYNNAFR